MSSPNPLEAPVTSATDGEFTFWFTTILLATIKKHLDEEREDPDLHVTVIKQEPLVLVAKPDHRLAQLDEVDIRMLGDEKLIVTEQGCSYREVIGNLYRNHGIRFEYTIELGSIEAIKRCVAYGLGIAFLPLMAVESELEKGSLVRILLPEADIHLSLQLVYHRKKWLSQSMKQLTSLLVREI